MNILAVCDPDVLFAGRLADYAGKKAGYPFLLQVFSSLETLNAYDRRRSPEAVLLAEELYDKNDWESYRGELFLLGSGFGDETGPERVFRYQEADGILREIVFLYQQKKPQSPAAGMKGHFTSWCICSPEETFADELLAFILAKELGTAEKVLFLDLMTWPGLPCLTGREAGGDLGELLYYLSKKPDQLMSRIAVHAQTVYGLDYLPGVSSPEDLLAMQPGDWKKLYEILKTQSPYTAVVTVTGNMLQPIEQFLKLQDEIWIPESGEGKQKELERYLVQKEHSELLNRSVHVRLPKENENRKMYEQSLSHLSRKIMEQRGKLHGGDGITIAAPAERTAGRDREGSGR